ncbi:RAB5C [Mytilus edulis]|uniref:RAB5C n=1 Tax=Mytilus edulis TaxID=6550 RepID=A0A8S3U796_MYTED|nr:RAB5C [Mytilus edulis]
MLDKLLGSGSYESFDMRCMVTGQFAVGKSSLVKLLVGDNVPEGRQPTDGISLIEGRCGLDIETRSWIMIDPATYNALDVVYNKVLMTSEEEDENKQTKTPKKPESDAKPVDSPNKDDTHSLKSEATKSTDFPVNLSSALFLVVFDGSKRLNEEIPDVLCFPGQHMTPTPAVFLLHWVNSILTYCKVVYAGIPKILFVATHKDKIPVEDVETRRALLYSEVEELFRDHEGRNHLVLDKQIFVNATDKADQEIESLKKAITELTFDHPCWGERMPNAWVPLELEIAELVAAGKQILSLEEVEELNTISKVAAQRLCYNQPTTYGGGHEILCDRQSILAKEKKNAGNIQKNVRQWDNMQRRHVQHLGPKDFRAILPYKEFIFNILIHLDILAEQRRYDIATGMRLPVDNYFVPCMVTERNTTSFMVKECKPERAICLAFVFKGTVIPPALPNRLISACLSMWTLKQYEGRKLLFSGFIVVSFDKAHDIVVCVEGNKILLYIVHKTSAGLIVPDIATGVKECLVTTMERISDFYQSTIHVKRSQQLPFHIEYSCSELKCFISEEEALQTNTWKIEQCEQNCQEMSEKWDDIQHNYQNNIKVAKFLVLSKWKEMKEESNFKALGRSSDKHGYINTCLVSNIPLEYLDCIPTDEILDALAPQIGQIFFQLGAELGLSIANLENIQSNNSQDLAAQNKEVLFTWREDRTVKPTLRVLVQALVNVGRGTLLAGSFENVDLNTLRWPGENRDRGAIPKKPKNTSEQKTHSQKKGSKKCSIA